MSKTAHTSSVFLLGLGARATEFYFQLLCESFAEESIHRAVIDFEHLNNHLPNDFEVLASSLEQALDLCDPSQSIIIPNVTLHETLDHHCAQSYRELYIHHPLTESTKALKAQQQKDVVLFASNYSMQAAYIFDFFMAQGINVRTPSSSDREFLDLFRIGVYNNLESPHQLDTFRSLIDMYSAESAVLIACTELSLILEEPLTSKCVYDTARLQVESVLKAN